MRTTGHASPGASQMAAAEKNDGRNVSTLSGSCSYGTLKEDRMKEYLDTVNAPPLTDEEIQVIDENGSKFHERFFMSVPSIHLVG